MRLTQYKVNNFRSVEDSGWIEADAVTALIGVNESGKTNLLLPLWKLNPAREGEIHPTSDYPKKMFGEIREEPESYCFITADFDAGQHASTIASKIGLSEEQAKIVRVSRYFDGTYTVNFPNYQRVTIVEKSTIASKLKKLLADVSDMAALKSEDTLKEKICVEVAVLKDRVTEDLKPAELKKLIVALGELLPDGPAKTSTIVPRTQQTIDELRVTYDELMAPAPEELEGVVGYIVKAMPKFVYYSNYGNLDSEIYLPHVVQNLERTDLGAKEAAKARTLRVLFKFVRLQPKEILELGRDFKEPGREPNDAEIAEIAEKKRERSILLQSAETSLTQKFKDWWKQGDYRFEFQADGNHFRIWVSDDRRPEKIELESRSTGLQWFLSFYLVFLVESLGEHKNAVLLLDEPGLSLHPLAQRNLSTFFDGLAETNQIAYTSHSPFLVDADRIERARKVYVANDGTTKATSDLRQGDLKGNQAGAAYAVHSALGLSVAESLLIGCQPIIVEGASDQHYLTAIKSLLISAQKIAPSRELVFPPSGGAKTVKIVAGILTGRDETLPLVLLDGDMPGKSMVRELTSGLYASEPEKVLITDDFVGHEDSEIEDLFPINFIAQVMDRWQRMPEVLFGDVAVVGKPIVGQIEEWAKAQNLQLPQHWKVELAKRVKERALTSGLDSFEGSTVEKWTKLFSRFM